MKNQNVTKFPLSKKGLMLLLATAGALPIAVSIPSDVGAATAPVFSGGDGTEANPYIITTAEQLNEVRNIGQFVGPANQHFILANDIDLSGFGSWTPIDVFMGTLDGAGHKITNLKVTMPYNSGAGLFSSLINGAVVKNLGLVDVNVSNYLGGQTGSLAGMVQYSTVLNCYATGQVASTQFQYTGGLVGFAFFGKVENSYATTNVTAAEGGSGGLVGLNNGTIKNSYAVGSVSQAPGLQSGGLIGINSDPLKIVNSYYDTNTSGQNDTDKGTPKSTSDMKKQTTFVDWDFNTIWTIQEGTDYPKLRVFSQQQDHLPTATPTLTGEAKVGKTLTASSGYADSDEDVEDGTTYAFYRYDDDGTSNETEVQAASGTNTYVIQAADVGKVIKVKVVPKNANGTGDEVTSGPTATITTETADITIGSVSGYIGKEVNVPVSISNITSDIAAYGLKFDFDKEALEVVSISHPTEDMGFLADFDSETGKMGAAWVDMTGGEQPLTGNDKQTLFTIKFKVKDNAAIGDKAITLSTVGDALDLTEGSLAKVNGNITAGKVTVKLVPALTYSPQKFSEATANDGSIDNTTPLTITLANDTDTFAPTNGEDFVAAGQLTVTNLPAGLKAVATRKNDTQLEVTLTGKATNHGEGDDIDDLTFAFTNTAFTGGDASVVVNATKADLTVDFTNNQPEIVLTSAEDQYVSGTNKVVLEGTAIDGNSSDSLKVSATIDGIKKEADVVAGKWKLEWLGSELSEKTYTNVEITVNDGQSLDNTASTTFTKTIIVDKTAPTIANIEKSLSNTTNQYVAIAVYASDVGSGIAVKKYALGTEVDFARDGTTFDGMLFNAYENGRYTIYVEDKAGNTMMRTIDVDIDAKLQPFTLKASPETPTNTDVTVMVENLDVDVETLKWAEGIQNKRYFANAGSDIAINSKIFTVSKNGTYTVYAKDYSGNEETATIVINNIVTDAEAVANAKTALEIGYAAGDSINSVTQSVTLPTAGADGTTITWTSDITNVIGTDGTVTRPANSAGDASVTLTATITKGGATTTKVFVLKVLKEAQTDAEAIANAKDALEIGYAAGDSINSVTQSVTLPTTGADGTTITWASDATNVIGTDGTVTRPANSAGDASVTLTATITKGGATTTKVFVLKVLKEAQTDVEAVTNAKGALEIGYAAGDSINSVTQSVTLPTTGADGTTITWTSDITNVIGTDGTVTRPANSAGDASVTLTATITKGGATTTKVFVLKVLKEAQTDVEAVTNAKGALEIGYAAGDSINSVTKAVTLPTTGADGTTITWASDATNVIGTDGTVTRPANSAGDASVTLTATITKGGATTTKVFVLKVLKEAQTDAEAIANAKDALEIGYAAGDSINSVTQSVTLPTTGADGTTITWTSDITNVIGTDGTVTRPTNSTGDASITLTATITKGGATTTKVFVLKVLKEAQTDVEAVTNVKGALEIGYAAGDSINSVTKAVTLPTTGADGTTITWTSDITNVIGTDGTVTRPTNSTGDASITLTATITKGGVTATKVFVLKVLKLNDIDAPQISYTPPTGRTNKAFLVTPIITDSGSGIASTKWAEGQQTESYFETNGTNFAESFEVAQNGTYTIYAIDRAGYQTVYTFTVENIDTIAPTLTVNVDNTATNEKVLITVEGSDLESGVETIKWLKGTRTTADFKDVGLQVENGSFEVTQNGNYTVYIRDFAGNEVIETVQVTSIDNEVPVIIVDVPTEWTNRDVTISATVTEKGSSIATTKWARGEQDATYFRDGNGEELTPYGVDATVTRNIGETTIEEQNAKQGVQQDSTIGEPEEVVPQDPTAEQSEGVVPQGPTAEQSEGVVPQDPTAEQSEGVVPQDPTAEQSEGVVPQDPTADQPEGEAPQDSTTDQLEEEAPQDPTVDLPEVEIQDPIAEQPGEAPQEPATDQPEGVAPQDPGVIEEPVPEIPEAQVPELLRALNSIPVAPNQEAIQLNYHFTVQENNTYTIYTRDEAGNEQISLVTVGNIDKTAPIINATVVDRDAINFESTIAVEITENGSGIKEKKWAKGELTVGDFASIDTDLVGSIFNVNENGTYTVYVKDHAGNESVGNVTVESITLPTIDVELIPLSTNDGTKVSVAIGNTSSPVIEKKWLKGVKTIADFASTENVIIDDNFTITEAGTYTVYIKDASGNEVVKTFAYQNKPYEITGLLSNEGGIKATATISLKDNANPTANTKYVVFQLMNGTTPVSVVAVEKTLQTTENVSAYFNVTGSGYTVIFNVLDKDVTNQTDVGRSLADSKTLTIQN